MKQFSYSVLTDSPLMRLVWIVAAVLFGLMVLLVIFGPRPGESGTILQRNRRFLVVLAWLCLGSFAARQILHFIESYFASSLLDSAAALCFWVSAGAFGGVAFVFHEVSEEGKRQAIQDFFRPLHIVKNQFRNIRVQGNAAIGNQGSQIIQSAQVSVEIQQQVHSFMGEVKAIPDSELSEDRKHEAIEHLHTLADQCMRPAALREPSKILTALKRVPTIFSGVATCVEAWEKLEPVVRSHLGF